MKRNDFEDQLRDIMAGYQEPLPKDSWSGIRQRLDAPKRRARFVSLLRKAAATFLLLLTGGTAYWLWMAREATPVQPPTACQTTPIQTSSAHQQESPSDLYSHTSLPEESEGASQDRADGMASAASPVRASHHIARQPVSPTMLQPDSSLVCRTDSPFVPSSSEEERNEVQHTLPASSVQSPTPIRPASPVRLHSSDIQHSASNISLSLSASNLMASASTSSPFVMSTSYMSSASYGDYMASVTKGSSTQMYLNNYDDEARHHQPFTVGLNTRYALTPRLGVQSGLTYTTTASDFIHHLNNQQTQDHQRLHYLGIPLRLDYQLLRLKPLSLYGVAGGEADLCVGAVITTDGVRYHVERDRMQFSAEAALGVQYDFMPRMGVYFEPGLRYYFDNGSSTQNIFKEKPFSFSLQLGLRLNVGKE